MKPFLHWITIFFLSFFIFSCARAGTYSLSLKYQPVKEFSSLQQKVGPTLGIAPFRDERPDTLYIGIHTPLRGISSHFKSDPFPLEKAMMDTLSQAFSRYGVGVVTVSNWDGKPESLRGMEADSVLMIEIKKFWTEGRTSLFRTSVQTVVHFVIHLGVKKEGRVFTRNVEVEREMTVARLTPERMEQTVNQLLTDIFDSFFSNPYEI
ncbi:MAG: hypothetical protein AB1502_11360 [Thermodesulfobacteriota bacterium]